MKETCLIVFPACARWRGVCRWLGGKELVGYVKKTNKGEDSYGDVQRQNVIKKSGDGPAKSDMLEEALTRVRDIGLHEHDMFIYRDLDEKHRVLFTYLGAALERGDFAGYVASEETPQQIREAMLDFGLDTEGFEASSSLGILNYEGVHTFCGRPDIARTLRLRDEGVELALDMGFKGVFGVGEAACFFDYGYIDELIELEKALKPRFERPVTTICAYNVRMLEKLSTRRLLDLFSAHSGASAIGSIM